MSDLTALALNAAHQLPVPELHGAVCGLAVCHGAALPLQDLMELVGVEALTDQEAVESFVTASIEDLQAEDMSFAPLLPADEVPLADRLEALGQWCGSFLAGLAAGLARQGIGSLDDCPEEVREIVRDFAAISQVDAGARGAENHRGGGTDEDADAGDTAGSPAELAAEADYVELEEFVKVGALLIMSTFGHDADDPAE